MSHSMKLAALCCAATLAACGGGGGGGEAATTAPDPAVTTPAPVAPPLATSASNCITGSHAFSLTDSTLAGAKTSLHSESATLSFVTPLTATTVKTCVIHRADPVFPATPAALAAVMTAHPTAVVYADGQFDRLSNKALAVTEVVKESESATLAAKQLVSYTPLAVSGSWVRTVLSTTQAPDPEAAPAGSVAIRFTAPITVPGFFALE